MTIVNVYGEECVPTVAERLDAIESTLRELKELVMTSMDSLTQAVAAEATVVQSAITLLQGLAAQIAALKPDQAAIDELAASVKVQTDDLAAAVAANTPGS